MNVNSITLSALTCRTYRNLLRLLSVILGCVITEWSQCSATCGSNSRKTRINTCKQQATTKHHFKFSSSSKANSLLEIEICAGLRRCVRRLWLLMNK